MPKMRITELQKEDEAAVSILAINYKCKQFK